MSIATYLNSLDNDRDTLAANLTTMGVQASSSETFTTLVPKVLTIPTGGGMEMKSSVTSSGITSSNSSTFSNAVSWFSFFEKMTFENKTFTWSSSMDFGFGFYSANTSLEELTFKDCTFSGGNVSFNKATFTALKKLYFENCPSGYVQADGVEELTLINTNYSRFKSNTNLKKVEFIMDTAYTPTRIDQLFIGDTALEYIDISGLDCTAISSSTYYKDAFTNVPTTCTIYVRNAANQTWFSEKFPAYTFTVKS